MFTKDEEHFLSSEQRLFRPSSLCSAKSDEMHKKSYSVVSLDQHRQSNSPVRSGKPLSSTVSSDFAYRQAVKHLYIKLLNEEEKLMRIRNVKRRLCSLG